MRRAFTIMELLVAVALLSAVVLASGLVFKVSVDTQRKAKATAEISRKLTTIKQQLDKDFENIRKDGEIFLVWIASAVDEDDDGTPERFERFDKIMFFTLGNFECYNTQPQTGTPEKDIRGYNSFARVCYMLAKNSDGTRAEAQDASKRILSRTQHIITPDTSIYISPIMSPLNQADFRDHNFKNEYDNNYPNLDAWKNEVNLDNADRARLLTIITDTVIRFTYTPSIPPSEWGTTVDPENPDTFHMLLCEGVGQFSIQGWYDAQQRWFPVVDLNGDGKLSDTDFIPDSSDPSLLWPYKAPAILYPYWPTDKSSPSPALYNRGGYYGPNTSYDPRDVVKSNFDKIPGFGRALKFTFTLYDSMGVFKEGKTFTHIVYLDKS